MFRFLFSALVALNLLLLQKPVFAQFFWGNSPQQEQQAARQQQERDRALRVQNRNQKQQSANQRDRDFQNEAPITRRQTYIPPQPPPMAPGIPQSAYREPTESGAVGFFKRLFGVSEEPATVIYAPQPKHVFTDPDAPKTYGGGATTVCVRTCDGSFAPISTGRRSGASRDQELCEAQCPGAEVKVFYLSSDDIETGRSPEGSTYLSLPNANKFKTSFTPNCSCRPHGKSWADFAQGREDPTMRSTDTVLSKDQAKVMALPVKERQLLEAQLRKERTTKTSEVKIQFENYSAPPVGETNAVRIIQASISPKMVMAEQPSKPNLLQVLRQQHRVGAPQ